MGGQIKGHHALGAMFQPPSLIPGDDILNGLAAVQLRGVRCFTRKQRCIETELGPDLNPNVAGIAALAISSNQRNASHVCQVGRDGTQRERDGPQGRWRLVFLEKVVINVHVLNDQVNAR